MNKIYSIFFIPLFWFTADVDCTADFELGAGSKNGSGEYAVELTLVKGDPDVYTLDLYDFNTGTIVATDKKYFGAGDKKVVFEHVKPSRYTIYFSSASCLKKKSLKGQGIVLQ